MIRVPRNEAKVATKGSVVAVSGRLALNFLPQNHFNKICNSAADTFNKFTFGNLFVSSRQLASFI